MKHVYFGWTAAMAAIVVMVVVTACSQSAPPSVPGAAPAAATDHGRFQVVVAPQGDRGSMVFMVDTRDGATWFFQPPQGALINGFWSNVPRLTFGDAYWEQVMRTMLTPTGTPSRATSPLTRPTPTP